MKDAPKPTVWWWIVPLIELLIVLAIFALAWNFFVR
jgi:hypothetical protein